MCYGFLMWHMIMGSASHDGINSNQNIIFLKMVLVVVLDEKYIYLFSLIIKDQCLQCIQLVNIDTNEYFYSGRPRVIQFVLRLVQCQTKQNFCILTVGRSYTRAEAILYFKQNISNNCLFNSKRITMNHIYLFTFAIRTYI